MNRFPILYKANKNGSIQFWQMVVSENGDGTGSLLTTFGQVGTLSPQETSDVIAKGKNTGKANETTAIQQALAEGQARWEKQIKKGYVEDIEKAAKGEDDIGGVLPMLAHRFDEHGDKISFPCFVQPKLDGIRCIAIFTQGRVSLFSRTRKPITGVPHIQRELETLFPGFHGLVLDGELYNHDCKDNFERIVSLVRQEEPSEGHEVVQYHVYDVVDGDDFHLRSSTVHDLLGEHEPKYLHQVWTTLVEDRAALDVEYSRFIESGYEGAIVRSMFGKYEHRRSYSLQKVKTFQDAEFKIVGVVEGRGKLAGHAIFECSTTEGSTFQVKLKGELSHLKQLYENPVLWQGKQLTVQYQGFSNANNVPRFPVGLRIREDE